VPPGCTVWRSGVIERGTLKEIMRPTNEPEVDDSQQLITVVEEPALSETALLREPALAADWGRAEEDAAWADLTPA
jgi:hypothetical protein